jgi:hypothetical protein
MIIVDSDEYRCWHEVGHAAVALYLGGVVEFIEFLDQVDVHARARCIVIPEHHRTVACGGFAAEFYLLNNGHAVQAPDDKRDISQIVFNNCSGDGHAYFDREYSSEGFEETEARQFMEHAIGKDGHGGLIPIIHNYFSRMEQVVRELYAARRIEGSRVTELLQPIRRLIR